MTTTFHSKPAYYYLELEFNMIATTAALPAQCLIDPQNFLKHALAYNL